jgi:hypothetical protein
MKGDGLNPYAVVFERDCHGAEMNIQRRLSHHGWQNRVWDRDSHEPTLSVQSLAAKMRKCGTSIASWRTLKVMQPLDDTRMTD